MYLVRSRIKKQHGNGVCWTSTGIHRTHNTLCELLCTTLYYVAGIYSSVSSSAAVLILIASQQKASVTRKRPLFGVEVQTDSYFVATG